MSNKELYKEGSGFSIAVSRGDDIKNDAIKNAYAEMLEELKAKNNGILEYMFVTDTSFAKREFSDFKYGHHKKSNGAPYSPHTNLYGIAIKVKRKVKFTPKHIESLEQYGNPIKYVSTDVPEYTMWIVYWFNTTGNSAEMWMYPEEPYKNTDNLSVTSNPNDAFIFLGTNQDLGTMDSTITNGVSKYGGMIHTLFYPDWVKKQKDHPLKNHYMVKEVNTKFGV